MKEVVLLGHLKTKQKFIGQSLATCPKHGELLRSDSEILSATAYEAASDAVCQYMCIPFFTSQPSWLIREANLDDSLRQQIGQGAHLHLPTCCVLPPTSCIGKRKMEQTRRKGGEESAGLECLQLSSLPL